MLGIALLLVAAASRFGVLGLDELPNWIRLSLAAGGIILVVLGVGWLLAVLFKWLHRTLTASGRRKAKREQVLGHIHALTREEAEVLFPMLINGQRFVMSQTGYGMPPWITTLHNRSLLRVKTYASQVAQFEVTEPLWSMREELESDLVEIMKLTGMRSEPNSA